MGWPWDSGEARCEPTAYGTKQFTPTGFDTLLVPAAWVFIYTTLARIAMIQVVLAPLARKCVGISKGPKDARMRTKFEEASWRMCIYAAACGWAAHLFIPHTDSMPWLQDSMEFWRGWPLHEVSDGMYSLYVLYVGFYVHQIIFLFLDIKSSDFEAMLVHHLITLTIVLGSWFGNFTRIGSFVMLLHDFSDVFLEMAKCFNYSQKEHPWMSTGADVTFVVFALSFFYLRLYIYPTRVLHSMVHPSGACTHAGCMLSGLDPSWSECIKQPAYQFFAPGLLGLQLLQIFWGVKVLGVIKTVVLGKPLEDPREEE